MNRSRYENRAKFVNAGHHRKAAQLPVDIPRDEFWKKHVKCQEDVVTFYQLYYPEVPDVMAKALAHYYQRAIDGEIELPPDFTSKPQEQHIKWDYKSEMLEEMKKGQTQVAIRKMDELMKE